MKPIQPTTRTWTFSIQIAVDSESELSKLLPSILEVLIKFFRIEDITRSWNWTIYVESTKDVSAGEIYRAINQLNLPIRVSVLKTQEPTYESRVSILAPGEPIPKLKE